MCRHHDGPSLPGATLQRAPQKLARTTIDGRERLVQKQERRLT
jgi:hypothetical protein